MSLNYEGLFKEWEIAVAKKLINEFQSKWELLKREGFEDLLQECLTHWFFAKDEYDPNQEASEKTFMYQVVKNKLTNIVDKIYADKRRSFYQSVSLDEPLGNDDDASALIETIVDNSSTDTILQAQLKINLSKAFQKLTSKQKELCRLLGEEGLSIKEASDHLKIPRGTLYEEIKRIRAIFRKENLEDYLK